MEDTQDDVVEEVAGGCQTEEVSRQEVREDGDEDLLNIRSLNGQLGNWEPTSFGRVSIAVDPTTILSRISIQTMEKNRWMTLADSSESREVCLYMSRGPDLCGSEIERSISESRPQPTIGLMMAPASRFEWTDQVISLSHSGEPQSHGNVDQVPVGAVLRNSLTASCRCARWSAQGHSAPTWY